MIFWLCASLVFVAFSLLAVFRAPALPLVFLAVGATELGHFFGAAAVLLALSAPFPASVLLFAASGFFFSPLARAWMCLPALRRAFEQDLGTRLRKPLIHPLAVAVPAVGHGARGVRIEGVPCFDFFRARAASPAPLVVIVHGGGWMAGSVEELAGWNSWLAERGFAVAAVDYRLMPTAAWPAQRDDVLAVVEHLRARASEYGIDPQRVVLIGRSAGGQIAAEIAAPGGRPWLRGCVCFYAPFDLLFAYEHSSDHDLLRSRWLLRCYLGGSPEVRAEAFRQASPYFTARGDAPPFLLLHGTRDELVWVGQGRRFARKLADAGVSCALVELPWATHAFDYNRSGPGGQITAACLEAFLRRVCG